MAAIALPRGVRLHNPGRLERIGIDWRGMAPDQSADPHLVVFQAPEWGIRALARTLLGYQHQEGCQTLGSLVARFRPAGRHDTIAYGRWLATSLDRRPAEKLSLDEPATLMGVVQAIIQRESGPLPTGRSAWYPRETIAHGLKLALGRRI